MESREHTALYRVERAQPRTVRNELCVTGRLFAPQVNTLFFEPRPKVAESYRHIYEIVEIIGLRLLADARAGEDHLYIVAVKLFEHLSMGDHGRHYRSDVPYVFLCVFANIVHYNGTCRRYVDARRSLVHELFGSCRHHFRSQGGLGNSAEAEFHDCGNQDLRWNIAEFAYIRRRKRHVYLAPVFFHSKARPGQPVSYFLGSRGAYLGTMAAVYTPFLHNGGLVIYDAYGFHRTLADTLVAILAVIRFGIDRSQHDSSSCKILCKRERLTSSYTLSSIHMIGPLPHIPSHNRPEKLISASRPLSFRYFFITSIFALFPRLKQELPRHIFI